MSTRSPARSRTSAMRIAASALVLGVMPASAAAARVYVSALNGVDTASCGARHSPCRMFAAAQMRTSAGGEIHILSAGDYGPIDVIKSISILNDSGGVAGVLNVPAGTNAIVIDGAASDRVVLRGLTVDAPAGGLNGVLVNTAGNVVFTELTVRHFLHGVNLCPRTGPANFLLANSYVSDSVNGVAIMAEEPPGSVVGVIDNVVSVNNRAFGARIDGDNAAAPTRLTIGNSVFSNNAQGVVGILSTTTATDVTLRNVVASGNVNVDAQNWGFGFGAQGAAVTLRIAQSAATGNNFGAKAVDGATIETFGDNKLRGNLVMDVQLLNGATFPKVVGQ